MEKENGLAYQIVILVIILVIAIAGVMINKVIGKNGVLNRASKVEIEYSKEDVLEKINHKVMQKFIEINNEAKANHKNIAEMYNSDVVIEFLKQSLIIEEIEDEKGKIKEGIYHINIGKLQEEETGVQYEGKFQLEKIEDKYMVVWYDQEGKAKEVGELKIQQT